MQVLTPSGYIDQSDIAVGDEVISYDIITGDEIVNVVQDVQVWDKDFFPDAHGAFEFYRINNTWSLYKNQSIWANGNVKHAFLIEEGDIIYDDQNNEIAVTSIEKILEAEETWYKFEISGDHSYIVDGLQLHNASRFWVGNGAAAWETTGASSGWAATSGGAAGQTVPTSADAVTFDTAANCTASNTANVAGSLTFAATFSGTLSMTNRVVLSGNMTLNLTPSVTGIGTLDINTAMTFTFNGFTWPNGCTFRGSNTKTLADNGSFGGALYIGASAEAVVINGNTLNIGGDLWIQTTTAVTGTTTLVMNGTGLWDNVATGELRNNLTFNTAGTITLSPTNILRYGTGTLTYTAGTIVATGSNVNFQTSCTINTNGMIWNSVSFQTITVTLSSNFDCVTLTLGSAAGTKTINGNTLTCINLNSSSATANTLAGSTNVTVNGGTVSATSAITVNKTNNLTFVGTINWTCPTFTRTAGTVVATGSALIFSGSRTFAGATTWNNWIVTNTATLTLNALQTLTGSLDLQASTAFAGSNSWTVDTLRCNTGGLTHTLANGKTYTINNYFFARGLVGTPILITSDSGSDANLVLLSGAVQYLKYVNGTSINSSSGRSINTDRGVLSSTTNWVTTYSKPSKRYQINGGRNLKKPTPRVSGYLKSN